MLTSSFHEFEALAVFHKVILVYLTPYEKIATNN